MKGPTAVAWSTDPVAAAKTAVDFAKTNEKLVLIGGALGTRMLDVAGIRALAELPSLPTLRAGLLGMLNTPATRLAGVLQAPAGQLARVFGAYAKRDWAPRGRTPRGRTTRRTRGGARGGLSDPGIPAPACMSEPRAGNSGLQGTNRSLD